MRHSIKNIQSLSQILKDLRKDQHLTQDKLSQFAGLSRQTLSDIERNKADMQVSTLLKLVKLLGYELVLERVHK